ncbi:MAG: ImmA/IrrE family metallo-endopeptidase [Clostridiales bacterium]|nr:ImmA/IrrE family metallo-endopeptidase [Clostridiales bacterium]
MFKPELRYSRSGMPIISNEEIDALGERMAVDFDQTVLLNPHPIDIERFVEKYLKMPIEFMYLSHCGVYLGTTVFQTTDYLPVFIPEDKCADYAHVEAGTVVIDGTLDDESQEHRLRFTLGHEGGHGVFHPTYFLNTIGSCDRDDTGIYVRCRSDFKISRRDTTGFCSLTDAERAEQQANRFSAAVLMPRSAVRILLASRQNNRTDMWIVTAISQISDTFNVSKEAAFYRLKDLKIIATDAKMPI